MAKMFHESRRNSTTVSSTLPSTTPQTSLELGSSEVQRDNTCPSAYEFYNILRQGNPVDWCEWHLNIDQNDNAIKVAQKFHQDLENVRFSPGIAAEIETISETFLHFMPDSAEWNKIKNDFKQALKSKTGSPLMIIQAYTTAQQFSSCLNRDCAANTYHALKLYCTLLNCPILARTQDYTEVITNIFFHPQLDTYLTQETTVYRGILLEDKKLIENYKEGATIITTTFLSTSTNPQVAKKWSDDPFGNKISIFCTYNISNNRRRTALDLRLISPFPDEREILILRYVPFTIKLVQRTVDGRNITISFDECEEY